MLSQNTRKLGKWFSPNVWMPMGTAPPAAHPSALISQEIHITRSLSCPRKCSEEKSFCHINLSGCHRGARSPSAVTSPQAATEPGREEQKSKVSNYLFVNNSGLTGFLRRNELTALQDAGLCFPSPKLGQGSLDPCPGAPAEEKGHIPHLPGLIQALTTPQSGLTSKPETAEEAGPKPPPTPTWSHQPSPARPGPASSHALPKAQASPAPKSSHSTRCGEKQHGPERESCNGETEAAEG